MMSKPRIPPVSQARNIPAVVDTIAPQAEPVKLLEERVVQGTARLIFILSRNSLRIIFYPVIYPPREKIYNAFDFFH